MEKPIKKIKKGRFQLEKGLFWYTACLYIGTQGNDARRLQYLAMQTLTFAAAKKMMNTGNEQTAQALRLDLAELYIGNGCYMEASDARQHLQPEHYTSGLNPLYLHLTEQGLKAILQKGRFVFASEE